MESSELLAALAEQGSSLVAAAEVAGHQAPVPSCPGWTVSTLLRHIGLVHRWADAVVRAGGPEIDQDAFDRDASVPGDAELAAWVLAGHGDLVRTLTELPDDHACWVLLPSPAPRHFWIRRQLHETAVHRIDAELAAGFRPAALAPLVAADGIDELLTVLVPAGPLTSAVRRRIAVSATDTGHGWTVDVSDHAPAVVREAGPADVTFSGPADAVYGYLWNRTDDGVTVDGDPELARVWRDQVRISR